MSYYKRLCELKASKSGNTPEPKEKFKSRRSRPIRPQSSNGSWRMSVAEGWTNAADEEDEYEFDMYEHSTSRPVSAPPAWTFTPQQKRSQSPPHMPAPSPSSFRPTSSSSNLSSSSTTLRSRPHSSSSPQRPARPSSAMSEMSAGWVFEDESEEQYVRRYFFPDDEQRKETCLSWLKHYDVKMKSSAMIERDTDYITHRYVDYLSTIAHPEGPPVDPLSRRVSLEEMVHWLQTTEPRSRVDAFPFFVLLRDVLRQLLDREMTFFSEDMDRLEEKLKKIQDEHAALKRQHLGLEQQLSMTEEELMTTKGTLQSKMGELTFLRDKLQQTQTQFEQLKAIDAASQSKIKYYENELSRLAIVSKTMKADLELARSQASKPRITEDNLVTMFKALDPKLLGLAVMQLYKQIGFDGYIEHFENLLGTDACNTLLLKLMERFSSTGPELYDALEPGINGQKPPAIVEELVTACLNKGEANATSLLGRMKVLLLHKMDAFVGHCSPSELGTHITSAMRIPAYATATAQALGESVPPATAEDAAPTKPAVETVDVETQCDIVKESKPTPQFLNPDGDDDDDDEGPADEPRPESAEKPLRLPESTKLRWNFAKLFYSSGTLQMAKLVTSVAKTPCKPMTVSKVLQLISEMYEKKIAADRVDDNNNNPRQNLADFMRDFLTHKFGLPSLAKKATLEFISCVLANKTIGRIATFGRLCGLLDVEHYAPQAIDFFLDLLIKVTNPETLRFTMEDKDYKLPRAFACQAVDSVCEKYPWIIPLRDSLVQKITENCEVQIARQGTGLRKAGAPEQVDVISLDTFSNIFIDSWVQHREQWKDRLAHLYHTYDSDGNGVIDVHEWEVMMKACDPDMSTRKMLEIYQHAGEVSDATDDVVTCEAFVLVGLHHQLDWDMEGELGLQE